MPEPALLMKKLMGWFCAATGETAAHSMRSEDVRMVRMGQSSIWPGPLS
jgi:hypothetical protein